MISILVLTFNEEANLASCLKSVSWSDDVVVFDSFSTDRTVDIARSLGARVVQRQWDSEVGQRTASLRVGFRYPWVYNPDADEICTPALSEEMRQVVANQSAAEAAYRVRFKHMFMGRWVKYSSLYPTWVVRLFRPERLGFERSVNLRYVIDGAVGILRNHFEHYSFAKGMNAWIEKHNRYSWLEACEALESHQAKRWFWRAMLSRDPVVRRQVLKDASFRMPGRPALRFVYSFIWRRGFLDGWPGFTYCCLMAWYEFMIGIKIREIRLKEAGGRL